MEENKVYNDNQKKPGETNDASQPISHLYNQLQVPNNHGSALNQFNNADNSEIQLYSQEISPKEELIKDCDLKFGTIRTHLKDSNIWLKYKEDKSNKLGTEEKESNTRLKNEEQEIKDHMKQLDAEKAKAQICKANSIKLVE